MPAAGLERNQEGLEPLSKLLGSQPSCVYQPDIFNGSQLNLETIKQFVCGVVQLRVAELHVKPLAREFNRATLPIDSEQEQVASIQVMHQD
jgi:hypothetical protein